MRHVIIIICASALFLTSCKKDEFKDPRFDNVIYDPTPYVLDYPDRFPLLDIPEDNPMTEEGVTLGRRLYYDQVLHIDNDRSCSTCHQQEHAFTSDASVLPHINLGWNNAFLWNGKVQGTLEDIMLFEVKDFFHADMDRLNAHPDYPVLVYKAFGEKVVTDELLAKALAQFERTMISSGSTYDRVMEGELFFTDEQYDGFEIFFTERGDCFHCHGGVLFTDNTFHNNGLDAIPEAGLGAITSAPQDMGKFKSPTLRNIELTGPYMHDGRYRTLEEVIDFYSEGLHDSQTIDPLMKQIRNGGVRLTEKEKRDLLAFLTMLTDHDFTVNPELSSPF
jgi:cytochrome c peroxidase